MHILYPKATKSINFIQKTTTYNVLLRGPTPIKFILHQVKHSHAHHHQLTTTMTKERNVSWKCADVEGVLAGITSTSCAPLQGNHGGACPFPTDMFVVDEIIVQQCSYSVASPATSVARTE